MLAALLVLGALAGAAGSLVQALWFPGGLLLALAGTGAVFYGGLRAYGAQAGVLAPGASWLVAVILLSLGRPEGDGVFFGSLSELLYVIGGLVAVVICATLARVPPAERRGGPLGG
ncbi:hypothetical protein C6N75_25945 [Streptomyces solincola]|uniref:Integral membrane protein n=1 Tax=Streptomyces solincola TaxID=2100817 RepID=A0A2S9PPQ3_9ACTN|nr:hypothetical protein C6N75_25945 [Streptomyces solincola]